MSPRLLLALLVVGCPGAEKPEDTGDSDTSDTARTATITLDGESGSFGTVLESTGDIDGDGLPELLVGDWETERVYLFYSGRLLRGGTIAAAAADVVFSADRGGAVGAALADAGDVDGDGLADVILGAPVEGEAGTYFGEAYVWFGSGLVSGGPRPTSGADVRLYVTEDSADDATATAVGSAGDVDGDGRAEVLVGAPAGGEGPCRSCGRAFGVSGAAIETGGELDLASATFLLSGVDAGSGFGGGFAHGDVDGDGRGDIVVHAAVGSVRRVELDLFLADTLLAGTASSSTADARVLSGRFAHVDAFDLADFGGDGKDELVIGYDAFSAEASEYTYVDSVAWAPVDTGIVDGPTGIVLVYDGARLATARAWSANDATTEVTSGDADRFGFDLDPGDDVDGDGLLDLEVLANGSLYTPGGVLLTAGGEQVATDGLGIHQIYRVTAADFDGDGRSDVAYTVLGSPASVEVMFR